VGVTYTYRCRAGEEITAPFPVDVITCLEHGLPAKRVRSFGVNKGPQRRDVARWDPIVGRYVSNHAEFLSALHEGQDRESAELSMDVKLVPVDAADTQALNELHGMTQADRDADLEPTRRHERDVVRA
jgi:hypothetical protein